MARFGIMKWMSSDAQTVVELIRITDPGTGRDVEKLRINRDGFFLADDAARTTHKARHRRRDPRETRTKLPGPQQGSAGRAAPLVASLNPSAGFLQDIPDDLGRVRIWLAASRSATSVSRLYS